MPQSILPFWSSHTEELFLQLNSSPEGLDENEVVSRLKNYGPNSIGIKKQATGFFIFLQQFKNPLTLILITAVILSFSLKQSTDAAVILIIIIASGLLSYWNERKSSIAVKKLLEIIQTKTRVIRNSTEKEIAAEEIVPGDIVILNAGDVIPADCYILEAKDLFVNEASLTGESYPAEKFPAVLSRDTPLNKRSNSLFMGTYVISGACKALAIQTGKQTVFGKLSLSLKHRPTETDFEAGIRKFGYLLLEITLLLIIIIFAINVYFSRPVLEAFLFSLAIAVGLTPQLLPAIISINLSHGAANMCRKKVIVRRLAAIENFGSMDVLCSDKTGTITEGTVVLHSITDYKGKENAKVSLYAFINATFESGFPNPIDEALRKSGTQNISDFKKLDEVPYDFSRKRLSILAAHGEENIMISKGSFENILNVCSRIETSPDVISDLDSGTINLVREKFNDLGNQGLRVLCIAYKHINGTTIKKEMEGGMVFLGFIALYDPPKKDIQSAIEHLKTLGVSLKIITGDNKIVAQNMGARLGLQQARILTGSDLQKISNEALPEQVKTTAIFAEAEPGQKERIIRALKKSGYVVGYLGDGINDAPALQAADVSISVDNAAEVAKSVADIVLLEKDLNVLIEGVKEGRRTFVNTLKYIFMAGSANFGNMFSMAGASLFLSFLPLLPKQVLLLNLMTDIPEIAIASDNTDEEMIKYPRHWNIKQIRNFMIVFGILSSVFDYLTFFVLLYLLHAGTDEFRTGWFIESVISASLIVLVIRTRKPFFKSKPGKYLFIATIIIAAICIYLPYSPLQSIFGFNALPFLFYATLAAIIAVYVLFAETAKYFFYRHNTDN